MNKCCNKMELVLSQKDKYWDRELYCKHCNACHWVVSD